MCFNPDYQKTLLSTFQSHYNTQLSLNETITNTFSFTLNLNESKHQNLIKILENTQLPILNYVDLQYVGDFNETDVVNKFMKQSISIGTKQFYFRNTNSKLNESECKKYVDGIVAAANKVHQLVFCKSLEWGKRSLKR